jgi:hypothetical protein
MKYFDFINIAFQKLESSPEISPVHRALFWGIVHRWNQNFFKPFEANRFDLMKLSGIKSEKTYFGVIADLANADFIKYTKGNNGKSKSTIEVDSVKFTYVESTYVESTYVENTEVEDSTYVNFTEVEQSYLGKDYLTPIYDTDILSSDTTIENTTDNKIESRNIIIEEKSEKKISKNPEKKIKKDCTFLDSEIGSIDTFSFYVQNSEYPDADINFWFGSLRDWIDNKTGKPPSRANWKLVFNTFIRNAIHRHGDYKKNGNFNYNKSKTELQNTFADIDDKVAKLLSI